MSTVRRSIGFSMIDKYLTQILLIVTTAIMARILTPAETGLYLTANAVVLLADNFRMFGVGIYIVQERELTRAVVRSAFTVTLVLSLVSGALVYGASGSIAAFYGSSELEHLFQLAAIGFLIVPFASPIIALLQRDLAFKALAAVNVVSALVGYAITIGLALHGIGPISYVWGYLATSLVMLLLALVARPQFWVFRPSLERVRDLVAFGAWSSLITVLNMAYELMPRLVFGRLLGFDAVGLYSRAVTITQLPDRALGAAFQPVIMPAFAAHLRAGGDARESYRQGVNLMTAVQWPALVMLAILADPVVRVLLGSQWTEAPHLVRLIALGSMALTPAFLTFPVLVSTGRIRHALYSSLLALPPSFAILVGASFISLEAVAASSFIVAPLQMFAAYVFVRRALGLEWLDLPRACRESAILTLGTAAIPLLVIVTSPTGFDLDWARTLLAIAGGAAGWLAALWLTDHPLKAELASITRLAGEAIARRWPFFASRTVARGSE